MALAVTRERHHHARCALRAPQSYDDAMPPDFLPCAIVVIYAIADIYFRQRYAGAYAFDMLMLDFRHAHY